MLKGEGRRRSSMARVLKGISSQGQSRSEACKVKVRLSFNNYGNFDMDFGIQWRDINIRSFHIFELKNVFGF